MFYITGDTHGSFERIDEFCRRWQLTQEDTVIILGDVGVNYYGGKKDRARKDQLAQLPPTFFCIHGNHERRPHHISSYREGVWRGGVVLAEENYPNILFPRDGEVFDLDGASAVVIGGAYSVDKHHRLRNNWMWFADEQPSDDVKRNVEQALDNRSWQVDYVLTHTCPQKHVPVEAFLKSVDQATVDRSTEQWLDAIEDRLTYRRWYCGHYHISKISDRIQFVYTDWVHL